MIILLLASTAYEALPIVSYANIMFVDILEGGFLVATLLFIRRIMRVFFDVPVGKIADKYGIKPIVYLAVIFKIAYLASLFPQTKVWLFVAVFFDGLAICCFRGKINILQYNILHKNNLQKFYIKYEAIYNILLYSFTFLAGLLGNIIFARYGYKALIGISIATVGITLVCFAIIPPTKKPIHNPKKPFYGKYNTIVGILRYPARLRILTILIGICSLGWQLNAINQFLIIKTSPDKIFASNIFNYGIIAMLIGSCISFIEPLRNIYTLTVIYFIINGLLALCPYILPSAYIGYALFSYLLFFVHYENMLRQEIILECDPSITYSVLSSSTSFTAGISIVLSYIFHTVGEYTSSYNFAYSLTFIIITAITAPALFILNKPANRQKPQIAK